MPRQRRLKLTIAYDGTDFSGWQVQPGRITVQGLLEEALSDVEKTKVHVAGSGRTDAGVHAMAQVAAVTLGNPIPVSNLKKALNRVLPEAVRVLDAEEVGADFHPRFQAISKTYEYRIYRGEVCSPFERKYIHHHPYPMNDQLFVEAAPLFEGLHDFSAFAAADDRDQHRRSKVRRIFSSRAEISGLRLTYEVKGSGFLKHMVRNMVGTLIEVAKGNISRETLVGLLGNPERKAGPRSPACGLYLKAVEY